MKNVHFLRFEDPRNFRTKSRIPTAMPEKDQIYTASLRARTLQKSPEAYFGVELEYSGDIYVFSDPT